MNGLEERRGILATIWLFHIMMDGAPQNGVGVLTHIYTAQTHTHMHMHALPQTETCLMLSSFLAAGQHHIRNHPITSPSLRDCRVLFTEIDPTFLKSRPVSMCA